VLTLRRENIVMKTCWCFKFWLKKKSFVLHIRKQIHRHRSGTINVYVQVKRSVKS